MPQFLLSSRTALYPPVAHRVKVLHVLLTLDPGGLERVVLELIVQGRRLGQQVDILCLQSRGSLAEEAERLGAHVFCVDKRPGLRLGLILRLKALLQKLRPDVVHTHQIGALFYTGPAARLARISVIVHTEHGKHFAARFRTRIIGRLAARHTARFFCVSQDLAAEVRRCRVASDSKIEVVRNGIDLSRFGTKPDRTLRKSLGIPDGARVIGTIGRLSEVKCQARLLRAFAVVKRVVPSAFLLIVGDGPLRADLERQAAELLIKDSTCFAGYQSAPERYLPFMDVFALTSRSEGMPLVVLEAWATGLPVVASAVGGLPEMIDHGRTGLLFPTENENALVQALIDLVSNPFAASALGDRGREHVHASFTAEAMAKAYQSYYVQLLNKHRSVLSPSVRFTLRSLPIATDTLL